MSEWIKPSQHLQSLKCKRIVLRDHQSSISNQKSILMSLQCLGPVAPSMHSESWLVGKKTTAGSSEGLAANEEAPALRDLNIGDRSHFRLTSFHFLKLTRVQFFPPGLPSLSLRLLRINYSRYFVWSLIMNLKAQAKNNPIKTCHPKLSVSHLNKPLLLRMKVFPTILCDPVPVERDVVVGSLWIEAPCGEFCWSVEQYWKCFPGQDYCQDHKLASDDQYCDGLLRPVPLRWEYLYSRDQALYNQLFMIYYRLLYFFHFNKTCQMKRIRTIRHWLELLLTHQ